MRVLFLTAAASWSGVEIHTLNWARALKERGHDVAIVDLGQHGFADAPQPVPCRVIHVRLGPEGRKALPLASLGFWAWRKIFSSLDADVAIAVKGTFQFGNLAMEAAARLRFPCFLAVEHYHAPLGRRTPWRLRQGRLPRLGLWWYRQKLAGYLRSIFPLPGGAVGQLGDYTGANSIRAVSTRNNITFGFPALSSPTMRPCLIPMSHLKMPVQSITNALVMTSSSASRAATPAA